MAERASELGVDIFPGTPGADVIYGEDGSVNGVVTGDFGISKNGLKK
jgi:electron-transferring-flavoprotein dehydrogenase